VKCGSSRYTGNEGRKMGDGRTPNLPPTRSHTPPSASAADAPLIDPPRSPPSHPPAMPAVKAGQRGHRVDTAARRDRAGVTAHKIGGVDTGGTGAWRRGWGLHSGGSRRCARGTGSAQGEY
jgi:hypothetical protein